MRIDERVDTCVRGLQMDVAAGEGMLEHSEEGEVVAWSQCGEELGGLRAMKHYMQRTAIQGNPNFLQSL